MTGSGQLIELKCVLFCIKMRPKVKYKKVIIYYFSGTGNAKNSAFWIGDEVRREGIDVEIISIDKIDTKKISKPADYTLIGFCSPTHGFHFPKIMRDFIYNFPKVNNCNAFIVNTRAGLRVGSLFLPGISGILHYWSSLVLFIKGFKIVGLQPVDLPSNWLSIHPAVRKKGIDLMYRRIEPIVRKFAINILNNKKVYRALYDIIQDTLVAPISIGYMFFGKYFFAKSFISSLDCDDCGICINNCPVKAIKKINERMYWTYKCESCMKCMNACPQRAIETAHGFIIAVIIISSIVVGYTINKTLTFSIFENWQWLQNETVKTLILTVFIFPFLFLAYRIMHWLLKYPFVERLIVFTSLSKFKFWGRYSPPKHRPSTTNSINQQLPNQ